MNPSSEEPSDKPVKLRLKELQVELDKGQRHLELLDGQRQQVRDTLLRISGAIQVLEELLKESPSSNGENHLPASSDRLAPSEASSRVAL